MSFRQKLMKEIREVLAVTLYFAICFGVVMALKRLYLEDYHIEFRGLSLALLGALVAAKVVLITEHVTCGQWARNHAVVINVVIRTLVCTVGVFVVLMLEKGIEGRHEHGGVAPAMAWVFQHRDVNEVWADTIAISVALLGFNAFSAVQKHLGKGDLRRLFFSPPAEEVNP